MSLCVRRFTLMAVMLTLLAAVTGCGFESTEGDGAVAPVEGVEPGEEAPPIGSGMPDETTRPDESGDLDPETPVPGDAAAACTEAGEICLNLGIPTNFQGTPENLMITFYKSLPPMGPPDIMANPIPNPQVVPGQVFPVKLEGVTGTGTLYAVAVLYMPGGGPYMPLAGVDYAGETSTPVTLTGGAVNIPEVIQMNLVPSVPPVDPGGPISDDPPADDPPGDDPPADDPPTDDTPGDDTPGTSTPGPTGPNAGPVPSFSRTTLFDDLPGAAWLKPVDMNNDGFDELLLSTLTEGVDFLSLPPLANGGAYILSRDGGAPEMGDGVGSWSASKKFDKNAGYGFPNKSNLMDMNNDGTMDWVIGVGFLAKPTGYILWMEGYQEGGDLSFGAPQELPIPDASRWYHEVAPVDLDNDGDMDFITTNNDSAIQGFGGLSYGTSRLEWYENLGIPGEAAFAQHTIADLGGALFDIYDIDEDGDTDVLLPQYFGGASLVWVENPGNPFDAWEPHIINDTTGRGFGAEVVDVDGNGTMEIVYGNHNHQLAEDPDDRVMGIYWWSIPDSATIASLGDWDETMHVVYEGFNVPTDTPDQDGAPGVLHVGDVDQDGDMDISASGDGDLGLYLFIQQAPGIFEKMVLDTGLTMAGDHVMMDLDADGDMDFVWCIFGKSGITGVQSYIYAYLQEEMIAPATEPEEEIPGDQMPGGEAPGQELPTDDGNEDAEVMDPGAPGAWEVSGASTTVQYGSGLFPTNIPVQVFMPEGDGPFPVVVFIDGFNLSGDLYYSYGQHLASWGYVTVMPDMPSNVVFSKTDVELKEYLGVVVDWIEDAAADTAGLLNGKADVDNLVVAGHSQGGKIAIFFALEDDRAKAVFAIDPVDAPPTFVTADESTYPSLAPEKMGQLAVPAVFVGETVNGGADGMNPAPCAALEENFQQYYASTAVAPVMMVEVIGASHFSFLDNPACGLTCNTCPAGTDDPATTLYLTQKYMVAFLNSAMGDMGAYTTFLTGAEMAADQAAGLVVSEAKNGF